MADRIATDGHNDGGFEKKTAPPPRISVVSTRGGDTNDWATRYELRVAGH